MKKEDMNLYDEEYGIILEYTGKIMNKETQITATDFETYHPTSQTMDHDYCVHNTRLFAPTKTKSVITSRTSHPQLSSNLLPNLTSIMCHNKEWLCKRRKMSQSPQLMRIHRFADKFENYNKLVF